MEGIIKFTPLLFSVALAYMYILLGTSFTNGQNLSATEVTKTSTVSGINLASAQNSTNVTNSKNESGDVLDLTTITVLQNGTERLDFLLFDDNSTNANKYLTHHHNGTSLPNNATTGSGTSENQNVTTWSNNQNKTAAFDNFMNDTTLIIDVPEIKDSSNRTNFTSPEGRTSLFQLNTTAPPISTGYYTYKPMDVNGTDENQTRSIGVTEPYLSSNIAQDRTPKVESRTEESVSNKTTYVTITSYADAFKSNSSNIEELENGTLDSNILIIPLNESESVPTMDPSTTLQIDSSLNVTEASTTMSTTLQAGSWMDSTTSKTAPDATKGRSWSSTLKNKLTTPIFTSNTTINTKETYAKTELSINSSRTEHDTVGDSEISTTVPTTRVTLLYIPYVYGNESTNTITDPTPTATTTGPTMLTPIPTTATTIGPTVLTPISWPTTASTKSPTMLTPISTSTTERKMFPTTEMTTVTDFKSEVDKTKEKPPKKKKYEELLPEEKENIVTVVFNKMSGNLTENFEDAFSYFLSRIMNSYLKMWSTLKEPENELNAGPEQAEVTEQNIHFLKPTPYFSKDMAVIVATFYVTSTSPSGALSVFPAEVVVQNLQEVRNQIQKQLNLNATDIFIGVHPNFDSIRPPEKRQLFGHFEPLFIALIAVAGTCLFTLLVAIIWFKCRQKGVEETADREKLNQDKTYSLRGQDLRPECEILREERQMAEKDGGMSNGEKKHLVRQNGEEGWVVPIGDMPHEDQNAPAIQDTRL